jgi:hypothetical protein
VPRVDPQANRKLTDGDAANARTLRRLRALANGEMPFGKAALAKPKLPE